MPAVMSPRVPTRLAIPRDPASGVAPFPAGYPSGDGADGPQPAVAPVAAWRVGGGRVLCPAPFLVAGIVNVTPDSFYDGGRHDTLEAAVAHGLKLAGDGADMLDVGGESTRPGSDPAPEDVEMARVVPVVRELSRRLAEMGAAPARSDASSPGTGCSPQAACPPVLSVDTTRAACAAACLAAGAAVVNDVSALSVDPGLLDVLVQHRPGYVLMHSQGAPKTMQAAPVYDDVADEVLAFFERGLARLTAAGLPEDNVALDPGIGFGKLLAHNLELLRALPRFAALGRPVYLGLSNKSLFGGLFGLDVAGRGPATMTATALCAVRGARIHRVHDVTAARQALTLVRELFFPAGGREPGGEAMR